MSQDFNTDLARRFRGVPIARGMLARSAAGPGKYLHTVEAANGTRVLLSSLREAAGQEPALVPMGWFDAADLLPDYRDAGTLGHLLAAVRAAWCAMSASLIEPLRHQVGEPALWQVVIEDDGGGVHEFESASGAEALAAAWEARPGREVEP